jgi:hypothetical protein
MKHTFAIIAILTLAFVRANAVLCPGNNGTHIRNQQVPGVGWAFAAVALVENQFYRETCEVIPMLSVEQVIDRANDYCPAANRSTLWCALHYMHIEGIMYEADYPYTLGVHETQEYDAGKLAPIAVSEPFAFCTEGNVSVRMDCTMDYLVNHSYASTICLDAFDIYISNPEICRTEKCKPIFHSIAFLFALNLISTVDAVYFQNSSGANWGANGVGRFLFIKNDRTLDEDPRNVLANALSVDVIRANHTIPSSASVLSDSNASASASASSRESSDIADDSSDSVKNGVARIVPFALTFLAAIIMRW